MLQIKTLKLPVNLVTHIGELFLGFSEYRLYLLGMQTYEICLNGKHLYEMLKYEKCLNFA